MTSEGLGEMFEGDFADTCTEKFPPMSMGGRAEGKVCADLGAKTPIDFSGNKTSGELSKFISSKSLEIFQTGQI